MLVLLSGLSTGVIYAGWSVAFYVVYRSVRTIEFGIVASVTMAVSITVALVNHVIVALVYSTLLAGLMASLAYVGVQRRLLKRDLATPLFFGSGLGLVIVAESLSLLIGSGGLPKRIEVSESARFSGALIWSFPLEQLILMTLCSGIILCVCVFVESSKSGRAIRAWGESAKLAKMLVGRRDLYRIIAYFLAGGLGAIVTVVEGTDAYLTPASALGLAIGGLIGFLGGSTRSAYLAACGGLIWGLVQTIFEPYIGGEGTRGLMLLVLAMLLGSKKELRGLLDF